MVTTAIDDSDGGAIQCARLEGAGRRALITGVAGFTGAYLAAELGAAGYRVFGSGMPGAPAGAGCETVEADLLDRTAVDRMVEQVRPDVVVHLAAISFVAHADAGQFYGVNIVGTRNLLEALAAQQRKPSAVLLASSANVYGNANAGLIDESVLPAPANDYAVSKLAMEYMARLWNDKLPIVIARPFNYTGVGQSDKFLLPKIVNHFRSGARWIELGNLAVARDFSDVRSVAAVYRRMLAACAPGETYNVCSGQAHSLAGVIDTMTAIAGYQIGVRINPAYVRSNDVRVLVGNNDKLRHAIGDIAPIALVDTLRWMYEA